MDGHDLRDYGLDELRQRIALVAQDTYLFNDTMRANILIAQPEASEAEVTLAVERAALSEFVSELPKGSTHRSASVACSFPVASASASPSPARFSRTPRC